mmetsp:Transcript_119022/g.336604  ORF Transcript_119022/g.336604 Transcript_119022/m.336604 type:complete len:283 (-) Transcript_119022:183-1031(-)
MKACTTLGRPAAWLLQRNSSSVGCCPTAIIRVSSCSGWIGFVSKLMTRKVVFVLSASASPTTLALWKLEHGRRSSSMWVFVPMAAVSLVATRGSRFALGMLVFEKSKRTRLGSSRCARCTIQIIQLTGFLLLVARTSFSSASNSSGLVHARTLFTRSSSMAHLALAFLRTSRLGLAVAFSFTLITASFMRAARPLSNKTFSMTSAASLQCRILWSSAFKSENTTLSNSSRTRVMRMQSPPKMSTRTWRSLIVLFVKSVMKSRHCPKAFKTSISILISFTSLV